MTPATLSRPPAPADDPLKRVPEGVDFSRLPAEVLAGLPTERDLPSADGEPMDTSWHRAAMNLLIDCLEYHWRDRSNYHVGGDMFVYFSPEHMFNKDFRGPDFFVVKGVATRPRLSYVVWQEGGRFPNVIVELASESTAHIDRGEKKRLYGETFRTPDYFIYDPATDTIEGWRLEEGAAGYDVPLEPDENGRLWSEELGLFLGPADGVFQRQPTRWPRFFDTRGRLIPTGREAEAARADRQAKRADRQKMQTDQEKARADQEKARADAAEAQLAYLKAELATLRNPPPQT